MSKDKGLVECAVCKARFTEDDILCYRYLIESGVCYKCLRRAQKKSSTCFGKKNEGKVVGFDRSAPECKTLCPDRDVCPKFISGEIAMRRELTTQQIKKALDFIHKDKSKPKPAGTIPYRASSAIGKAFLMCMKGCSVKTLETFAKKEDISKPWLLRQLRRELRRGASWSFTENSKGYKITL